MRAGAVPSTGQQFEKEKRDEHPTLRITNLSEEVTEADVRALVDRFGPTARVFCAKYPGTQICKGFAFVSFYSKSDGDKCISVLNGHGYANLILSVEWAKATADKK